MDNSSTSAWISPLVFFVPPRKNRHGCCFRPPLSLAALLRSTNFSTCHWIPDTVYVCRQSTTRWEPWSISVPLIAHFWCCPHVATNAYATCSRVPNVLGGYFYIAKLSHRRDMVAGMSLDVLNLQRKLYLCWLRVDSQWKTIYTDIKINGVYIRFDDFAFHNGRLHAAFKVSGSTIQSSSNILAPTLPTSVLGLKIFRCSGTVVV